MKKLYSLILSLCLILSCFVFTACDSTNSDNNDSSNSTKTTISMPYNSTDYTNWNIDDLVKHFEDLGFTEIEKDGYAPNDDNFTQNIFDVKIKTSWLSGKKDWSAGDEFEKDKKIIIKYNSAPAITIDNCSDFAKILTDKSTIDYLEFSENYDGRYFILSGFVSYHTYQYGIRVMNIKGGDYSGNDIYSGYTLYVDETWNSEIDYSVIVGDNVTVTGKINEYYADYYNTVVIDVLTLEKR